MEGRGTYGDGLQTGPAGNGNAKPGFSQETIRRVREALEGRECVNPWFGMELTEDSLSSSFGYGEGISVFFENGKYLGYHNRERAFDREEYGSEDEAADRFILISRAGKSIRCE